MLMQYCVALAVLLSISPPCNKWHFSTFGILLQPNIQLPCCRSATPEEMAFHFSIFWRMFQVIYPAESDDMPSEDEHVDAVLRGARCLAVDQPPLKKITFSFIRLISALFGRQFQHFLANFKLDIQKVMGFK
jgi:hypothetical protein